MDAKGIKRFLEWGRKHETMFPTIGFKLNIIKSCRFSN